jgi:hypothetical protein
LAFWGIALLFSTKAQSTGGEDVFVRDVEPLLKRFCFDCHGKSEPEAELALAAFSSQQEVQADRATWKRVWLALHAREMPPPEGLQPTADERNRITDWLEKALAQPLRGAQADPGHVVLRRLNRIEYDNTVKDLFSIYRLTAYFDPRKGMPEEIRIVLHRDHRDSLVDLPPDDVGYGYDNIGEVLSLPPFLMEKYLIAARQVVSIAAGEEGGRPARMFQPIRSNAPDRDRAQAVLEDFLPRAFRRRVSDEEVAKYLALYDLAAQRGEPYQKALKVPLQAALVSPHFLFKVERGIAEEEKDGVRPLSDHELAVRLSYFLWSSLPDAELFQLAEEGRLRDPKVLKEQAARMLHDRRVKEFIENFPPQWLQITGLLGATPDEDHFPHFHRQKYPNEAMRREALILFETIVVEDRSVLDLIDPDYIWLNGTLADYYGVAPGMAMVRNSSMFWKRYELKDHRRGGVLTLGAQLLMTSDPIRTSPVKRGKWVLETLLGTPPPPPLADVPDLDSTPPAEDGLSLRVKLQNHRADPNCASCHRRIDPLGFALENFDAAGAWREKDGPIEIDAAGTLVDGTKIDGPIELKALLAGERKDDFTRCLTEHLMTYGLGRKLDYYDIATVSEIIKATAADDYRFSTLIQEIVASYPFRYLPVARDAKAERQFADPDSQSR